ncbi:helix-turn-helix transcriptional regulator [Staphylococcus saprophyticus]|nr:helix-turn-helix transcriptional regulator [Staphylococcus saprophyticus]MDW4082746.1 helix-turn-helix transcriptional regulator [Staphylococcus saprophyticus]
MENDMLKSQIGAFLKGVRKNKGITANQLGDKIQYSQSHISGVENAKKTMPTFKFIEDYLTGISETNTEYNTYIKQLNEITDGAINLDTIEIDDYSDENLSGLAHNLSWKDGQGVEHKEYFDKPINDLDFHLKDINNSKLFGFNVLEMQDRTLIHNFIYDYLNEKHRVQLVLIEEFIEQLDGIDENDTEKGIKEVKKNYEERMTKLLDGALNVKAHWGKDD